MALSEKERLIEKTKLKETCEIIDKELKGKKTKIETSLEGIKEWSKMQWSSFRELDKGEESEFYRENDERLNELEREDKYYKRLYKVKDNPYFGLINFEGEDIYIGITSLKQDLDYLIYDWRAPICSMFYDYGLGESSYKSPKGIEKGNISKKRQYKIQNRELKQVFDTSLNIDDEMLQAVLAEHSSDKMKNIVNTIQVEQNEVIRNDKDKNIIVQGIAGSGKTSVALHRVAYLLYKIENLNSNNVLIFSPNNVFAEYISEVLPDLGEDNTLNTTYNDFLYSILDEYEGVESYSKFVERYYKGKRQDNDLIKFKLSDDIVKLLEKFAAYFTKAVRFTENLEFKKKTIPFDELNELLQVRYDNKPLFDRFYFISEKISNMYYTGTESEQNMIYKKLFKISNIKNDFKLIYKNFYNSSIFINNYKGIYRKNENMANLEKNIVNYEDASLIAYLKCLLKGYPYKVYVKEVIIDEAQDYTYLQMKILSRIFKNADFTILGDVNQTVNPFYKYDTLEILRNLFEKSKYIELNKTYRSSKEIIEYANNVLHLNHASAIRRGESVPVLKRKLNDIKHIGYDLKYLKDKYKSIAVITKSIDEANLIYNEFKDKYKNISVIDITTSAYHRELVVAPAYGVKGLEFDAVIIINNFSDDKYLYYVAVTRAQHELIVYE